MSNLSSRSIVSMATSVEPGRMLTISVRGTPSRESDAASPRAMLIASLVPRSALAGIREHGTSRQSSPVQRTRSPATTLFPAPPSPRMTRGVAMLPSWPKPNSRRRSTAGMYFGRVASRARMDAAISVAKGDGLGAGGNKAASTASWFSTVWRARRNSSPSAVTWALALVRSSLQRSFDTAASR